MEKLSGFGVGRADQEMLRADMFDREMALHRRALTAQRKAVGGNYRACSNCIWGRRDESIEGLMLRCYFEPPRPVFPIVGPSDFCSHFEGGDQ